MKIKKENLKITGCNKTDYIYENTSREIKKIQLTTKKENQENKANPKTWKLKTCKLREILKHKMKL